MSAREPSRSGALDGSPASMHGEPASSRRSPLASDANAGLALMFPTPGVGTSRSVHVAVLENKLAPVGWLPQTMQLRRVEFAAAAPLVVPWIEFSAKVQRRSRHPSTAPPLVEPEPPKRMALRQNTERSTVPGPAIAAPRAKLTDEDDVLPWNVQSRTVNGM